jgi:dipeptidyl aminopeptidase/acylaminoacyl peptidase
MGTDKPELKKVEFEAYLQVKSAIMPAFAADEKCLYYLSDITGSMQVWSVAVEGGWPDQLTFFEEQVGIIEPSPDGKRFLITRDRGGDEQHQLYLLQGDAAHGVEITALTAQPEVKHEFGVWRADGGAISFSSNARNKTFFDVYTLELDGASEPKLVYQADANLNVAAWSHSGRYLVFSRSNSNVDNDLFLLDLEQPQAEPRQLTSHTETTFYGSARFSPDDKQLYLRTDQGRDFLGLACLELDSLELKWLATPDWDVETLHLSPDGSCLAYTVNEGGASKLIIRGTGANITEKEVTGLPQGVIEHLAWSPDGKQVAFDFTSAVLNPDVWVYDLAEEHLWQVTHSPRGGLDPASFVEPELVQFSSFDGLQIPAFWFLPKGAKPDGKTPVVVYVHGGPESQTKLTWSYIHQYLLGRGYAVLATNVRGSSGYGKHYLSLDDVRKRMDSVADLKYGVEWLRQNPYVDPKKIVVWGRSYGGFMVLSAVTTYPDLWAAAVDIVGIANFVSFMENTSSYRRKLRAAEYGSLENDRDFLTEISPIHKVDRITAPLIVLHGARDPRVPVTEAEQMVNSLRQRNHPVEYLRFEDEGHMFTKLNTRRVAYPAIADFLDKYLR